MEGLELSKVLMDLFLNLLNIALIFIIVRILVYKPVKKFLDSRIEKINTAGDEAAARKAEAEKLKLEYESLLAEADLKTNEIISEGKKKASEEASAIIAEAKKASEAFFEESKAKIEKEREASVKAMKKEVASLAVDITKKLLAREINDSDNLKIAEDFFADNAGKK